MTPTARPRRIRTGPLLMVLATLAFTVMVVFVKIASDEMTALEIIIWRGAVAVPATGLLALRQGYRLRSPGLFAGRVVFGFGAMLGFYTAAAGLTLTDLTLINKLQPIVVALLAGIILGRSERPTWLVAVAAVAGLTGASLIIGADLQIGSIYALIALGGCLSSGVAHVCLRGLTRTNSPATIVFWFQVAGVLFALGLQFATVGSLPLPPASTWGPLLGVGLGATAGQVFMTMGYARDRAAAVAAASYAAPIWSVAADVAIFGSLPGPVVWLGGAIVVAAGLSLVLIPNRGDDPQPHMG